MAVFSYRAVDGAGKLVDGQQVCPDRANLLDDLRRQGLQPIYIKERGSTGGRAAGGLGGLGFSLTLNKERHLGDEGLALFTREMATLVDAGLPLEQALSMLAQQQNGQSAGAKAAAGLLEKIRAGSTFADALGAEPDLFPGHYIGLVRAGEAGGTLDQVLMSLADNLERARALKQDIKSALNYPILILVASGGAVLVLLLGVIPEFEPLFAGAGAALPASARFVMGASRALREFWWALPLLAFGLFIFLRLVSQNQAVRDKVHGWMLDIPVVGPLLRKIEAARFCGTLGALLTNGVEVVPALQMSGRTVSNSKLARAVEQALPRLRRGEGLTGPLEESGILPPLALRLLRVGETSGKLDAMLLTIARIYEGEISRETRKLVSMLVPLVTLFLGFVVAGIIGSILSAILTSYDLPF
ncbi:type II secretion system protein F [Iodidimonas gelatinilytica]|uniref:Type II secretion system protein F n=1 Tax=Iodidimonas gelatinilytica TaxID=1236966 RepID=A0A5A7MKY6_9PROT|nr:type II secretion system F family protein [Iodidimonas gelatinilytica]GEQ96600.1 type II secretion system protein F [Iodidimonas gelatinilytica]